MVDGEVALTGVLDLRGRIGVIGGEREKVLATKKEGIALMMVPMNNFVELNRQGWETEDEEEYVKRSVKGVKTFVDVMELAIKGD